MFFALISTLIIMLSATAREVLASPQAATTTGTLLPLPQVCHVPNYGPFKLFARGPHLQADVPVRLFTDTSRLSHVVVNTNSVCILLLLS